MLARIMFFQNKHSLTLYGAAVSLRSQNPNLFTFCDILAN